MSDQLRINLNGAFAHAARQAALLYSVRSGRNISVAEAVRMELMRLWGPRLENAPRLETDRDRYTNSLTGSNTGAMNGAMTGSVPNNGVNNGANNGAMNGANSDTLELGNPFDGVGI